MGIFDSVAAAIKIPFQQPVQHERSKEKMLELWAKDAEARRIRERQWQINMSMYMGSHWIGWDSISLIVDELKAPAHKIQAVNNILYVKSRAKMLRLMSDATPQALPESGSDLDVRRARYKERVLAHVRREINERMIRYRAAQWLVVTGDVYLEAYWNADSGDVYADDAGLITTGEIGVKVRGPWDVWPGASASCENYGGRVWVADVMPVDLAKMQYQDAEDISADANSSTDMRLKSRFESFFTSGAQGLSGSGDDTKALEDSVVVKTLYEFRTKSLPQGRVSIVINDKVVSESPLDWFGISHIANMPNFSSFYGDTELRQSIQRQKSYNRLLSNAEEYLRVMKGKWLVSANSKITRQQIDTEHGEVLTYSGSGQPPQPISPPPLPNDLWQLMDRNAEAISDCFSDHNASAGKAAASTSGSALNYMIEQDQAGHMGGRMLWDAGWERTWEKCLDLVGKHYDETRTITVLGEDSRADVEQYMPDLLAGKNRIKIVLGTSLPENKTLRSELIRRNFTDGLYGDPTLEETRRKVLRLLDAGIIDEIYSDTALDEQRAEKENMALAKGVFTAPRPEDDHFVHARIIRRHMKTETFLGYPPEVQEMFYVHMQMHDENGMPPMGMGIPPGPNPASSPMASNPEDLTKSVIQGGEPPPAEGV